MKHPDALPSLKLAQACAEHEDPEHAAYTLEMILMLAGELDLPKQVRAELYCRRCVYTECTDAKAKGGLVEWYRNLGKQGK